MIAKNPARGVLFLYIGSIGGMGLSYFYWFIVARVTNPGIVGVASAAFSLVAIVWSSVDLGLAYGLRRFLGETHAKGAKSEFRNYLNIAVALLALTGVIAICSVFVVRNIPYLVEFPNIILAIVATTVLFANLASPFQSALISMMRTDCYATAEIVSGAAKVVVGTILVLIGMESLGVLIGLTSMYAISFLLNFMFTRTSLKEGNSKIALKFDKKQGAIELLRAGMPTYFPSVIQTWGTRIGVLLVFGTVGAIQTGYYYIALQFFAVIILIPNTISSLLFPYISGHKNRDAETMKQGIKFAHILSAPILFALLAYPYLPLVIMGTDYIAASPMLQYLLLGVPLIAITGGVNSLAYARGRYRVVLSIGLSTNIPRLILYFILTPTFAGEGAAIAYLAGSIVGLFVAGAAANMMKFSVGWIQSAMALLPPLVIYLPIWLLDIHWLIGIPLVLGLSVIVYMRSGFLSRKELVALGAMVLSDSMIERFAPYLRRILTVIYGNEN
jgi:O-antigen/teichoic acid export membrane protein